MAPTVPSTRLIVNVTDVNETKTTLINGTLANHYGNRAHRQRSFNPVSGGYESC